MGGGAKADVGWYGAVKTVEAFMCKVTSHRRHRFCVQHHTMASCARHCRDAAETKTPVYLLSSWLAAVEDASGERREQKVRMDKVTVQKQLMCDLS